MLTSLHSLLTMSAFTSWSRVPKYLFTLHLHRINIVENAGLTRVFAKATFYQFFCFVQVLFLKSSLCVFGQAVWNSLFWLAWPWTRRIPFCSECWNYSILHHVLSTRMFLKFFLFSCTVVHVDQVALKWGWPSIAWSSCPLGWLQSKF